MNLDYTSILFFLILNNLFIILLFIYQYFYHHKPWYLLVSILGILFQSIAFIIFGYRDHIPVIYTVRVANFLMISSFALTSFGLISFDSKLRKNILWTFLIVGFLAYSSILILEKNFVIIHLVRLTSCSFFYGVSAFYLYTNKNKYKFSILLSSVLLTFSIFQLIRGFNIYITDQQDFFKVSVINNWFFVIFVFVISASTIGFIMLLKEIDQKTILKKNLIIQKDKLKLEGLYRTQNKLFSIIAHDLRSPFNNILGLSEILINSSDDKDQSDSEKYIHLISSTAQNSLILLDNLLNWAKSQTEELHINPEKINLSKVINETMELKKSLVKAKNITLHCSSTNEIELYTDKNILETILRNLISNAIKYTNFGGHIGIIVTENQHQIEISIADNGVGMSKETVRNIFELSNHVSSPGTANEKGSGLGLVLCKEFIEKLNGTFLVESEKGKGSTFKFTLPLKNTKL